jgi:hypothetical protein
MNSLEIKYDFQSLELMLNKISFFENQYKANKLKVKYEMFIGNNEYYSIFVIE